VAAEISQARGSRFQLCNVDDEVKELLSGTEVYNEFEILSSIQTCTFAFSITYKTTIKPISK
jgi:hypothetical protein